MQQVYGDQRIAKHTPRRAFADCVRAKPFKGAASNLQDPVKFDHGVRTAIPQMSSRMSAALGPGIGIGNEFQAFLQGIIQNLLEPFRLSLLIEKLRVAVRNRYFIPFANSNRISIGQQRISLLGQFNKRVGVIHNGCILVGAGGKIMRDAQRVPNLMRRQLPDTS